MTVNHLGVCMPNRPMAAGAVDPLRAYVITLRKLRRVSQQQAADELGLSRRAYFSWERGETQDITLGRARKLIALVEGSFEHLDTIDSLSIDEARALTIEWAQLPVEQQRSLSRARQRLQRIIALAEDDPARLERVVEQLRADARADPHVLDLITIYLDGRRSARDSAQ